MADSVQYALDGMVNDLQNLCHRGIFSEVSNNGSFANMYFLSAEVRAEASRRILPTVSLHSTRNGQYRVCLKPGRMSHSSA